MDNNRKIRWGSHLLVRIVLIVHLKDREHAENAMVLTELDLRIFRTHRADMIVTQDYRV